MVCNQLGWNISQHNDGQVMFDGSRIGEAMDIFFTFSPELNLGGFLPFQVTHRPCPFSGDCFPLLLCSPVLESVYDGP